MMSGLGYNPGMAHRSTFLVHVTADGRVWIETVATGEVVSVASLGLVGAAIERSLSEMDSGQDAGVQR